MSVLVLQIISVGEKELLLTSVLIFDLAIRLLGAYGVAVASDCGIF